MSYEPNTTFKTIYASDVTDVTVSASLLETITDAILIPANTFSPGDILNFTGRIRGVGAGGTVLRTYIDPTPTPTLLGATQVSGSFTGAGGTYSQDHRYIVIKSATVTEFMSVNQDAHIDWNAVNIPLAATQMNIDWTIDQYFVITIQGIAPNTSVTRSFYLITNE